MNWQTNHHSGIKTWQLADERWHGEANSSGYGGTTASQHSGISYSGSWVEIRSDGGDDAVPERKWTNWSQAKSQFDSPALTSASSKDDGDDQAQEKGKSKNKKKKRRSKERVVESARMQKGKPRKVVAR